jgi:UPF0716 protein FxsA
MFKKLLLVFLIVPIAEVLALFVLAHFLGWGWTLGLTLLSSLTGFFLARYSGKQWWRTVRSEWAEDGFPMQRIGEGAILLVSMAFMITPGPLTGIIGLLFLIPKLRMSTARWLFRWATSAFMDRHLL